MPGTSNPTSFHMIAATTFLLGLAGLPSCALDAQIRPENKSVKVDTVKYSCDLIGISADTVRLKDSVRVRLRFSLDCTNEIIRFQTAFDTSEGKSRVVLSVYGTATTGPYRPLCPAVMVDKVFPLHFPSRALWQIDAGPPLTEDSLSVSPEVLVK